MSQNRTSTDFPGTTTGQTGSSGTPSERSTTGTTGTGIGTPGSTGTGTGTTGTGTGTATGLAQEYGGKISEAATQAKDYVSDKITVVGDKIKELQNADLSEITENAKDYARKNPGQAILISAAAGLLVGLILRGSRR
ncbi:MAG: hypothetical protein M3Y84_05335 [Acidobacteriota bacterium]|nr:hypothetical protein [Acidobacteriota bacterium]